MTHRGGYRTRPMGTWTEEERDRVRAKERRRWANWSPEQKAKHRVRGLKWYHCHKKQADDRAYLISAKKLYGLSAEDYKKMVVAQAGVCALCKKIPPVGKRRALHIDHNHETNTVRALLCHPCNRGLAYVENLEWLQLAQAYLARQNIKETP